METRKSSSNARVINYSSLATWRSCFPWSTFSVRRLLLASCAFLAAASLFGLLNVLLWTHQSKFEIALIQEGETVDAAEPLLKLDKWGPLNVLRGPATDSFWDNLRNDTKYVTSWPSSGWTNDVMTFGNLVYLALITDRIPVIPPFIPTHVGGEAGYIYFGDIFNVTRLSQSIGIPVIEWRDIKKPESVVEDEMGCWDIWEASQLNADEPRQSDIPPLINLDISYTRAPNWVKLLPDEPNDLHTTFWALAALAFPDARNAELTPPRPSVNHGVTLPPNPHFLCYDYLYYVCALKPFEYGLDYSPAWRYATRYMRWTDSLEQIGEKYVRKALGIADGVPIPPYISIHARHNDFRVYCEDIPLKDCYAPPSAIARRVREVQDELLETKGIHVKDVIMTSDEVDPVWWAEVAELGFKSPDHSKTAEEYGHWYYVLIDAVIQSNGIGFVGTDGSTMSEIAMRRCQTWHGGVTRIFKWGYVGADDH